jgi:hypothetical protein
MNWLHSLIASPVQACSGEPCAAAGIGAQVKESNIITAAPVAERLRRGFPFLISFLLDCFERALVFVPFPWKCGVTITFALLQTKCQSK